MVQHNMETPSNIITWGDVDRLSRQVADRLPALSGVDSFDRVIGISRGGLVPAVLIGSHLEIKRIESAQVRFYDGDQKLAEPILVGARPSAYGPSGDPARTLIVDEILDSGATMDFLRGLFPEATLAALVARHPDCEAAGPGGLIPCTSDPSQGAAARVWVAEGLGTDRWILFPWSPPEDRAAETREAGTAAS